MLHELLFGVGPFDHLPMLSLLSPNMRATRLHAERAARPARRGLLGVLRRALAGAREDRFASAREMLAALQPYMPSWEEGARQVAALHPAAGPPRQRRHRLGRPARARAIGPRAVWEPSLDGAPPTRSPPTLHRRHGGVLDQHPPLSPPPTVPPARPPDRRQAVNRHQRPRGASTMRIVLIDEQQSYREALRHRPLARGAHLRERPRRHRPAAVRAHREPAARSASCSTSSSGTPTPSRPCASCTGGGCAPRTLILTSQSNTAFVRDAFRAGADGYAFKSQPLDEVMDAMRVAAGRRALPEPPAAPRCRRG